MNKKEELLNELDHCVVDMEDEKVVSVAKEYLDNGFEAVDGIRDGLSKGMEKAGKLFEDEEYFVPELLLCSSAMYNGLDVLKEKLKKDDIKNAIPVIIGVVEGDTHDIGKNLVKIMMEAAGFEIHDLGRDVPVETFIDEAKKLKKGLLCMSTLMTTTMMNMGRVIDRLKEEGIRENFKVMIGGGPISKAFADKIGADSYTENAEKAAEVAKILAKELENK